MAIDNTDYDYDDSSSSDNPYKKEEERKLQKEKEDRRREKEDASYGGTVEPKNANPNAPGVIDGEIPNSNLTSPYIGNPVQAHMAPAFTDPRHVVLSAMVTGNWLSVIVFEQPASTAAGFDQVDFITDITGDTLSSLSNTPQTSSGQYHYMYHWIPGITWPTLLPHYRQYRITFTSGFTKDLEILCPVPGAPGSAVYNGMTSVFAWDVGGFAVHMFPYECTGTDPFQWTDTAGTMSASPNAIYFSVFSRGVEDPNSIFPTWAAAYKLTTNSVGRDLGAQTIVNDLLNLSTPVITDWKVQENTISSQVFEVVVLTDERWNISNSNNSTNNHSLLYDSLYPPSGPPTFNNSWFGNDMMGPIISGDWAAPFFSAVVYAENLGNCSPGQYHIDACNDPNNMAYWGYTGLDCHDNAIPAAVIVDPTLAVFSQIRCCPDCKNVDAGDPGYSTDPFTIDVQGYDPTTPGGTDGYINVTTVDGGFDASGIPTGLITGTPNYTFVLQNQDATDTMCGNTAGVAISSGSSLATTIKSFTFGFGSLSSNPNGGLLQTGAAGNATYVASSAQGYIPAATGTTNTEGLRAGTYDVYVFDSNFDDTGVIPCLAQATVTLNAPANTVGCSDPNALNTDPLVTITDNTLCHYCDASTGELVDGNTPANIVDDINQTSGPVFDITTHPDHTTATNTVLKIQNISPTAQFQAYINDVVTGTTQNADYMFAVYKWDVQSTAGSFAASSIVGAAVNNQGTGWNTNTVTTASLGGNLTMGYYSLKIWISDPDAVVEIEECYEILDFIIPVPVCDDGGSFTDLNGISVTDPNLRYVDQSICPPVPCSCDDVILSAHSSNTVCAPIYQGIVNCSHSHHYFKIELQYYDNGSWVTVTQNVYGTLTVSSLMVIFPNTWGTGGIYNNNDFSTYGDGDYRLKWTSKRQGGPLCTEYSNTVNITLGIYGCTSPSALNYNPLADCNDGSCIYCVYGCTTATAFNYDPSATCDDGSCIFCVYGCTDITASNYDPLATCDDGSCISNPCGCTDPLALNYNSLVTCDDGSCIYCDPVPMGHTYTTTAATASVISSGSGFYCQSNADGCLHLTVTSTTCTSQFNLISTNANLVLNANYSYNTQIDICNLSAGSYGFTLIDCNGCQMPITMNVSTTGSTCGCTDPAASNYNPSATYDDGSCLFCGCRDSNALNYNPNATSDCGTCIYPSLVPPCIPINLDQTIARLEVCIAENGFNYYNKLITGKSDDCSIMNVWKLLLVTYLLDRIGLECIYNCADIGTPDPTSVYTTCESTWITGGPNTGLNDTAVSGTGVGTTSDVTMFTTGSLTPGDVIKHHISGGIWIFNGPTQNGPPSPVSVAGLDPESASGNASGYWHWCTDNILYTSNSNNINYLDNFINFANTFCRDCGNNPKNLSLSNEQSIESTSTNTLYIGLDGIEEIEI